MAASLQDSPEGAVALALAGDESAFRWIVERFSADMTQVAFVVCGDHALADDAVALAWRSSGGACGRFGTDSSLRAWLVAIAANEARDLASRQRRRRVREIALEAADPDVPASAVNREAALDLANALARLTPDDRALLALRYIAGLNSFENSRQRPVDRRPARAPAWPDSSIDCERLRR